jgi:hypothetical protein
MSPLKTVKYTEHFGLLFALLKHHYCNFFIKNQPIIHFSADFYVQRLFRCPVAEIPAARKKGSTDWGA